VNSLRFPIRRDFNQLLLGIFGCAARNSYVDVTNDAIHFKFGWGFDEVIPRDEIATLGPSQDPWLSGIGGNRIALLGSNTGVVEVGLAHPRRMRVFVVPVRLQRIAVSLEDPDAFTHALRPTEPNGG